MEDVDEGQDELLAGRVRRYKDELPVGFVKDESKRGDAGEGKGQIIQGAFEVLDDIGQQGDAEGDRDTMRCRLGDKP